ncbi:MAG: proton-conducting membrane transporter, partial [Oscillospiraceae bacterium]|nr:proton-conducting membrane transporter [Oscillospiraceae bacterium]
MNKILLTLPVFLPLVVGLASYFIRFKRETARRWFYGLLICGTSALVWVAVLSNNGEALTLLRFTDTLDITLRMDGASRLFAALSATLWPFTMVYAWDYMHHEKHLDMFWAFFTAAFGITLGIAFSANMMTMYLFYELLTLSTIPLVMQAATRQAIRAGVKYAA